MKVDRGGFNRSLEMGGMRIWGSRIVALLYAIKLNESFTRWSWREGGSYIKPWERVCTSNTSGIHMSGSSSACSYARSWLARGERIHGKSTIVLEAMHQSDDPWTSHPRSQWPSWLLPALGPSFYITVAPAGGGAQRHRRIVSSQPSPVHLHSNCDKPPDSCDGD